MKKLLLIPFMFLLVACDPEFNHDPYSDFPEQKSYVPIYDRELEIQYYLSPNSVTLEADTLVEMVRGENREIELSFKVDFLSADNFFLTTENFPSWLSLKRLNATEGNYIISGTPPKDFIPSGLNGDHTITITLNPKKSVPENIVKRLENYKTTTEISLIFLNSQGGQ